MILYPERFQRVKCLLIFDVAVKLSFSNLVFINSVYLRPGKLPLKNSVPQRFFPFDFTEYSSIQNLIMPSDKHVKAAFSLIEDKSKVLGLTIGKHENVQPGAYIPRGGMYRFGR
jgi:hypothetical protein